MAKLTFDDAKNAMKTVEVFLDEYRESISEELTVTKEKEARDKLLHTYTLLSSSREVARSLSYTLRQADPKDPA